MHEQRLYAVLSARQLQSRSASRRMVWHSPALLSRFSLKTRLVHHSGCVNTIAWNEQGTLLVSGSDDCRICIWSAWNDDHAKLQAAYTTGHRRNIFCAKFVPLSGDKQVVTCALDGSVRLTDVNNPEGADQRLLGLSSRFVSKFEFVPGDAHTFIAAGQDGLVCLYDLRHPVRAQDSFQQQPIVDLSAIGGCTTLAFDPCNPSIFALGCEDPLVRAYDLRKVCHGHDESVHSQPLQAFAVEAHISSRGRRHPQGGGLLSRGASGLAYSMRGELIANMRGDSVYRFDVLRPSHSMTEVDGVPTCTAVLSEYSGRVNDDTFAKEVCLLHQDAYIATGGDCGNLYIWHTVSAKQVLKVRADACIVNCLAPHPSLPLLAVSGIDSDVKLFSLGDSRPADADARQSGASFSRTACGRRQRRVLRVELLTAEEGQKRLEIATAHRERGNSLFRSGLSVNALVAYESALQSATFHPSSAQIQVEQQRCNVMSWLNLAAVHLLAKDYREALTCCNLVLKVEPENAKGLYRRAQARLGLDDLGKCDADLKAALGLMPGDSALRRLQCRLSAAQRKGRSKENILRGLFSSEGRADNFRLLRQTGEDGDAGGAISGSQEHGAEDNDTVDEGSDDEDSDDEVSDDEDSDDEDSNDEDSNDEDRGNEDSNDEDEDDEGDADEDESGSNGGGEPGFGGGDDCPGDDIEAEGVQCEVLEDVGNAD
eukprot:CAMPEP_0183348976 /NCGR_PEP_ID=MMETSP0164_2-20130417/13305_1 /TAXON_ID=221442 /ORGANISM="Coccolithus pelagicus ssp braarudi, Strain PLY182g" /LENGTH=709 /DNA_ID=CAMNT_0025520643 /DNA_START=5 /DNA_END=2137 /DNA_ORIENTATION=+